MEASRIKEMDKAERDALIADVFEARRDLPDLAVAHGLSPDDLAGWISQEENQRCLAGLCLLADLQTQLMLSRYRQVAVTELIKQASAPGSDNSHGVSAEQARKACVDLLKADLKRTQVVMPIADDGERQEYNAMREMESIRAALFGEASDDDVKGDAGVSHVGDDESEKAEGCDDE